jgi:cytochrome P450
MTEMPSTAPSFKLGYVPAGRWLVGHLWEFKQHPLDVMAAWRRLHGDLAQFQLGTRSCYLVSHPELAEEALLHKPDDFSKIYDPDKPTGLGLVLGNGLLTSEGPLWKKNRRLIQPVFQRQRVASMAKEMLSAGEDLLKRWDALDPRRPVDVAVEMIKVTLDVITRTMFSASLLHEVGRLAPALDTLLRYAFRSFHNPLRVPLWVPTPGNRAFQGAKAAVDRLIYGLIRARRASGIRHDDLLDQLLHAADQDSGLGLTDEQLRDELLTIAAAGHETTANALSWAWYLLARHADVRTRLYEELTNVLGTRRPTIDDIPRLVYTRSVFEETLRLYPPAPALQRKAVRDTSLGGCPLAAGSLVIIGLWNIHRHPNFWDEPETFRPERFAEATETARHRLAWMPFGAGHRTCVGNHFAMIEGPLLLALIVQRYELDLVPGSIIEPEVAVTVRPKNGLKVMLRKR